MWPLLYVMPLVMCQAPTAASQGVPPRGARVNTFGFERWMDNSNVNRLEGDSLAMEALTTVHRELTSARVRQGLVEVLVAQCKLQPHNFPPHVLATLQDAEVCLLDVKDGLEDLSRTDTPGFQIRYQVAVRLLCFYVPELSTCYIPTIAKIFGCHGNETAAFEELSEFLQNAETLYCEDRKFLPTRLQSQEHCISQGWLSILNKVTAKDWQKPVPDKEYLCQIIVTVRDTFQKNLQTGCGYETVVEETNKFFNSLLRNIGCY